MAISIEAFKSGRHTDNSGNKREWTNTDLDTMVTKYNEQSTDEKRNAPVVLGHPETNHPAYGWVESLKREGNKLIANLKDLKPDFVKWVNDGSYRERSISLYPDLKLRHIAFLGAVQPAVPGLAALPTFYSEPMADEAITIDFSLSDDAITIEFSENEFAIAGSGSLTVDETIIARDARAILYGIAAKQTGQLIKPDVFKDIPDDKFADPVNYKYPINDIPNLMASQEEFNSWDDTYTDVEKHVIMTRILKSALDLKIDIMKNARFFSEKETPKPNAEEEVTTIINFMENPMDPKFFSELLSFVKDSLGAPAETKISAQIDVLKKKYPATPAKADKPAFPGAAPKFSESEPEVPTPPAPSKEFLSLQTEFNEMKKKNKKLEFSQWCKENMHILTPAMIPALETLVDVADSAVNPPDGFAFSEGEKVTMLPTGMDAVKNFVAKMPQHKLTSEFASDGSSPLPADSLEEQRKLIDERNKNKK